MVFRWGECSWPCWGFPWPWAHRCFLKSWSTLFERVEFLHQSLHFPLLFLQPPATVQGSRVDGVCFCVEDVAPSPQDALPIGGDHCIEGGAVVVNKVGWVKQKVEVFHSLGQEERLHAVVKLVVSQIFDLPRGRGEQVRRTFQCSRKGQGTPLGIPGLPLNSWGPLGKLLSQLPTGLPASILTLKHIYITSLTSHSSTENLQLMPHFTETKKQRTGPNRSLVVWPLPARPLCPLLLQVQPQGLSVLWANKHTPKPGSFNLENSSFRHPHSLLPHFFPVSTQMLPLQTGLPWSLSDLTIPIRFIVPFCDYKHRSNDPL